MTPSIEMTDTFLYSGLVDQSQNQRDEVHDEPVEDRDQAHFDATGQDVGRDLIVKPLEEIGTAALVVGVFWTLMGFIPEIQGFRQSRSGLMPLFRRSWSSSAESTTVPSVISR